MKKLILLFLTITLTLSAAETAITISQMQDKISAYEKVNKEELAKGNHYKVVTLKHYKEVLRVLLTKSYK